MYRGRAVHISLRPRLKIEDVMKSEIVSTVVDKLAVAGRTGEGEVGDGKIFVIGVEDAVRIRTGEHGPDTVQHGERAMWGTYEREPHGLPRPGAFAPGLFTLR
jgi:hypothetical protein